MEDIKVSIICDTYNQKDYIGDALESFVMQKTNFNFEVLVHDDASVDGTKDVIREYEKRYPDIVKPLYQKENQYSKRIKIDYDIQMPRAQGTYIAVCEGDDYWTDPYKLQKQYDYMEAHQNCFLCAHAAEEVNSETKIVLGLSKLENHKKEYGMREAINGFGRWTATCSMFMRRELLENLPKFAYTAPCGDYVWPIIAAQKGYIAYLPDNMAAHRVQAKNSMAESWSKDHNKMFVYYQEYEEMLKEIDDYTQKMYTKEIECEQTRIWFNFYVLERDKNALRSEKYRNYIKTLPLKQQIKTYVKVYAPGVIQIYSKLWRWLNEMRR